MNNNWLLTLWLVVTHGLGAPQASYFDELQKWQMQNSAQQYQSFGDLLIFASFSMPEQSLRQLIAEVHRVNGHLIMRGLVNNSFKDTTREIYRLIQDSRQGGVAIDPTLFKKFNIEKVPAFVVVDHHDLSRQLCAKYDVIYGNVSLEYALRKIARDGEQKDLAQSILRARGV